MELTRARKLYLLLSVLFLVALFFMLSYMQSDNTDADYSYNINEDGVTVTLTGYSGDDRSLTIPGEIDGYKVSAIGKSAFQNKTKLKKLKLPDSVAKIGEYAFDNCASLVSVKMSAGVEIIDAYAFCDCENLSSLELPEGLRSIGDFAFYSCVRLGKVNIPASVTEIGTDAFAVCENLLLDVSKNELAAGVAKQYNIATDYTGTDGFMWLKLILITVPAAALAILLMVLLPRAIKRKQKNKKS